MSGGIAPVGVSLKAIAHRAGVSLATVSNVINGYRPVGEATREATRHGYTLLLDYTDGDRAKELLVSDGFRDQIIDGLIMSPVQLDRQAVLNRTSATPLVLIGERVGGAPYDHIARDNLASSH